MFSKEGGMECSSYRVQFHHAIYRSHSNGVLKGPKIFEFTDFKHLWKSQRKKKIFLQRPLILITVLIRRADFIVIALSIRSADFIVIALRPNTYRAHPVYDFK